jgi:hypothetical protein
MKFFKRLTKLVSGTSTRQRATSPNRTTKATARFHPFRAVSVCPGTLSCASVKKLADMRFLARNAPMLPLQTCTRSQACTCRFRKYTDRRSDERRFAATEPALWYAGPERRGTPRRRAV